MKGIAYLPTCLYSTPKMQQVVDNFCFVREWVFCVMFFKGRARILYVTLNPFLCGMQKIKHKQGCHIISYELACSEPLTYKYSSEWLGGLIYSGDGIHISLLYFTLLHPGLHRRTSVTSLYSVIRCFTSLLFYYQFSANDRNTVTGLHQYSESPSVHLTS